MREAGGNISRAAQSLGPVAPGAVPSHGAIQLAAAQRRLKRRRLDAGASEPEGQTGVVAPERIVAWPRRLSAWAAHAFGERASGSWSLIVAAAVLPVFWLAARVMRPIGQMLRALSGTVASYREGDFSLSLVVDRDDELGELMTAHNELAAALRTQRAHLVQRELLLDTVMQNSPVALVLVDAHERIAYANIAARHLLSEGRSLNGLRFGDALARAPPALRDAAAAHGRQPVLDRDRRGRGDIPPVAARLHSAGTHVSAVPAQAADARAVPPGSLDVEEADSRAEP